MDILIAGVGGQGTLLASNILGALAMSLGRDVKLSEVHGMSQRGGSVVTYVRMADEPKARVASPVIDYGMADVLLAFEKLECARSLPYLKENGTIFCNTRQIAPMPVITGAAKYPRGLEGLFYRYGNTVLVDALDLASQAGTPKAVNVAMLGVLSNAFKDVSEEVWDAALEECVKPQFLELNRKAFALGRAAGARFM